jgi:hypothetical protein
VLQILEGSIVTGKSGKPLKVISVDSDGLVLESDSGIVKAKRSAILRVISPPPEPTQLPPQTIASELLHIGDRVTLIDKYMVRAADTGAIEAISDKGIQVLWDNKIPNEPNLRQPPMLWRTFPANELELVQSMNEQN